MRMHKNILSLLLMIFFVQPSGAEEFVPEKVSLVATSPESKTARAGIHRARLDQKITLYAVLYAKQNGKQLIVSKMPERTFDGRKIIKPEKVSGKVELEWKKIQPVKNSYNNTEGGFHWDQIDYKEFSWGGWGTSWKKVADAHPLAPYQDVNSGAGTMAFKVTVRVGDKVVSSPGKESIDRGGLSAEVIRVAYRRDDTFIGYLTELFNTPYIWGSAGVPPEVHQAERLIGSDCADFVVYGARRMGKDLRYRSSWHLGEMADTVATAIRVDDKGRFTDANGKHLIISKDKIRIGDLLWFQGHVGALVKDMAPEGILDNNDIMIHTYWAPPAEEPISATAYSQSAVKVLRWK